MENKDEIKEEKPSKLKTFFGPAQKVTNRFSTYIEATYNKECSLENFIKSNIESMCSAIRYKSECHQYSAIWEIDTNIEGLEQAILDKLKSENFSFVDISKQVNAFRKTIFISWGPLLQKSNKENGN